MTVSSRMDERTQEKLKLYLVFTIVIAFIVASLGLLCCYVYFGFTSGVWLKILEDHFATLVILPFGAGCALLIVCLLRVTSGPIEFEALGFRFRGASGPIVLWCMVFLTLMIAVKMLW